MEHATRAPAVAAPPTIAALRRATRAMHDQLELGLNIAHPGAGHAEYRFYIERLWGWHQAFEHRLWTHHWPAEIEATARAAKLDWLATDLDAMGMDAAARAALPRSGFAPQLDLPAARFGLAYVIEGAQLGVRVLHKQLAPQLAPWSPRWLQGYGPEAGARWKIFTACLEREVSTDAARTTAVAAAQAAFESLVNWFEYRQE